jgi:hypothetical protein
MGVGLVAAFSISALFASSALAEPSLTLETAKGPLAPGAEVVVTSSDLTTTTIDGALACSEAVLRGTLTTTTRGVDTVTVPVATATGTEPGGGCTSPLGEAQIEAQNLPWTLTLKKNGLAYIQSASKLAFASTFPNLGGISCVFERRRIKSQFPIGTAAQPIELTASEQLFKRNAEASNEACPKSGEMNGNFTVTSEGEAVLAHV